MSNEKKLSIYSKLTKVLKYAGWVLIPVGVVASIAVATLSALGAGFVTLFAISGLGGASVIASSICETFADECAAKINETSDTYCDVKAAKFETPHEYNFELNNEIGKNIYEEQSSVVEIDKDGKIL